MPNVFTTNPAPPPSFAPTTLSPLPDARQAGVGGDLLDMDPSTALPRFRPVAPPLDATAMINAAYDNKNAQTTELRQADFASGTVRLRAPGVYRLMEDIVFEPNAGDDHNPVCPWQTLYCDAETVRAYKLGFFAAVTMEGRGVVLDLNGHTLRQSEAHALQQRFFAVVETARQPFIPKQGPQPGGFGNHTFGCEDCAIINGHLGLSSHHGVHGNNNTRLLIENVTFSDYEVAGIHLNGARDTVLRNVELRGHRTNIPTRATYSAARFLLQTIDPLILPIRGSQPLLRNSSNPARVELLAKRNALKALMDEVLAGVRAGTFPPAHDSSEAASAAYRQFALAPTGADNARVLDGNAYGISLSSAGIVIAQWKASRASASPHGSPLSGVHLSGVKIRNVRSAPMEIQTISIAAAGASVKPQADTAGSVVRLNEIMNATGHYVPDALHDLRFSLAWWSSADGGADPDLVRLRSVKKGLGTLSIDATTARWAREGITSLVDIVAASQSTADAKYSFVCNIDSMNHVQKGVVGLLVQAGDGVTADEDLVIDKVTNDGAVGGHSHPNVCSPTYRYHSAAGKAAGMVGYTGCQTRGVAITASQGVDFKRLTVNGVRSARCDATGVNLFNDVKNITVRGGTVTHCDAGYELAENATMPVGGFPTSMPVAVEQPSELIRLNLTRAFE